MHYKMVSIVLFTASLNGSQELCAIVRKSIGTASYCMFQKLLTQVQAQAPQAQLSYQYPCVTIEHNGTLKDTNDLEAANDWYKLIVNKESSSATTTVMRFEYIAKKNRNSINKLSLGSSLRRQGSMLFYPLQYKFDAQSILMCT